MVNQLIQKKNKRPVGSQHPWDQGLSEKATADILSRTGGPDTANTISLEAKLQTGFTEKGLDEGLKVLLGLKKEYDTLEQLFVGRGTQDTLIDADKVRKLTGSLYLQGLKLLTQALDTAQQLGGTNTTVLELENKDLKEDLEKAGSETLRGMIQERLDRNNKSLKIVKGYRDKLDEIFCQVGLSKDSIREIRLELPELLTHKPKDEMDKTLLELRTRIEFAQRVHEEYNRQGL